jgi:hypothetical protein
MRPRLAVCLPIATIILQLSSNVFAQTGRVDSTGMLEDPPAAIAPTGAGEFRPMPTEAPVADPTAVLPSASLEDLAGVSLAAETASSAAPARRIRPQPFPEEVKP